eukprot:762178-Prorocentrum_lima.AAC.1
MPTIQEEEEPSGGAGVVGAAGPQMSAEAPAFTPAQPRTRPPAEVEARRSYIVEATKELQHAPEPTNNTIYDP